MVQNILGIIPESLFNPSVRVEGDADVLAFSAHHNGLALVAQIDVGHPDFVAQQQTLSTKGSAGMTVCSSHSGKSQPRISPPKHQQNVRSEFLTLQNNYKLNYIA